MTHKQSILDEFDEKFYEGDSNAIHCSKHKYYATPTEIKAFISRALVQEPRASVVAGEGGGAVHRNK